MDVWVNKSGAFKTGAGAVTRMSKDSICYVHSGLVDRNKNAVLSYLHKAIKALNQLRMIEDSFVIYRLSRAPERRIFYIDVGNLPKIKAEQYLREVMNRYRNKLVYDANTGEVRDDRKMMSMLEDFWPIVAKVVVELRSLLYLVDKILVNLQTLNTSKRNYTEHLVFPSLDLHLVVVSILVVLLKF